MQGTFEGSPVAEFAGQHRHGCCRKVVQGPLHLLDQERVDAHRAAHDDHVGVDDLGDRRRRLAQRPPGLRHCRSRRRVAGLGHREQGQGPGDGVQDQKGWGNVMYIPAAPYCAKNAEYAARCGQSFLAGTSPTDVPPEDYEVGWAGRPTAADLSETGAACWA